MESREFADVAPIGRMDEQAPEPPAVNDRIRSTSSQLPAEGKAQNAAKRKSKPNTRISVANPSRISSKGKKQASDFASNNTNASIASGKSSRKTWATDWESAELSDGESAAPAQGSTDVPAKDPSKDMVADASVSTSKVGKRNPSKVANKTSTRQVAGPTKQVVGKTRKSGAPAVRQHPENEPSWSEPGTAAPALGTAEVPAQQPTNEPVSAASASAVSSSPCDDNTTQPEAADSDTSSEGSQEAELVACTSGAPKENVEVTREMPEMIANEARPMRPASEMTVDSMQLTSTSADKPKYVTTASGHMDAHRVLMARTGVPPESWHGTIAGADHYHQGSFVAHVVERNVGGQFTPAQQQQARLMERVRAHPVAGHVASSAMVADAFVVAGANPYAVCELGMDVMLDFRKKSFILIVMQVIAVLSIGVMIDFSPMAEEKHPGTYAVGGLCIVLVLVLLCVAGVRHEYPLNYMVEVIFTLVAGACLGLSTKPMVRAQEICCPNYAKADKPGLHAFAFYTVGLCITAKLSTMSTEGRHMLKCLPSAFIAMICVNFLFFVAHYMNKFCPFNWLVLMDLVVSLCLLWVGFECDRLALKLKVDEYLLPVILVWADLLVLVAVVLAVIPMLVCSCMAGESGGDADCCSGSNSTMNGCYGCDCSGGCIWVTNTDVRSQDVNRRQREAEEREEEYRRRQAEAGQAPLPQAMGR